MSMQGLSRPKSVYSVYFLYLYDFEKLPDFIFKPKYLKSDVKDEFGKQIMNNMLSSLLAF